MQNLERIITRARNMLVYGLTHEEVSSELERIGYSPELVFWAVRGAQFELKQLEELENAQIQG